MLKVYLKRLPGYDANLGWSDTISLVTLVKVPTYNSINLNGEELELHYDLGSAEISLSVLQLLQNILRQTNYCYIYKFNLL